MKCSQFTTAVSLCLRRRTKFTAMRNFSLARVLSFPSSPSPPPPPPIPSFRHSTVVISRTDGFSLLFSRLSPRRNTRCQVSPFILMLGFKGCKGFQRLLAYQQCSYFYSSIYRYRIFLDYGLLIINIFFNLS